MPTCRFDFGDESRISSRRLKLVRCRAGAGWGSTSHLERTCPETPETRTRHRPDATALPEVKSLARTPAEKRELAAWLTAGAGAAESQLAPFLAAAEAAGAETETAALDAALDAVQKVTAWSALREHRRGSGHHYRLRQHSCRKK